MVQSPLRVRVEAAINATKTEMDKVGAAQLAFQTQLAEPELVFRALSFTNFVSTWLIRIADPNHKHPNPNVEYVHCSATRWAVSELPCRLPLPKEVPIAFKTLPEYIIEDIVEYHLFISRLVVFLLLSDKHLICKPAVQNRT